MAEYTEAFKSKMVQRLLGPRAISAMELSREVGVHQSTLSAWLRKARGGTLLSMSNGSKEDEVPRGRPRSAEEKIRILAAASAISGDELGALLRREGVHEAELEQWRAALEGNASAPSSKPAESKRIKELERELRRKDKALAEAAALLVLQKKVREIWGAEDDGTDEGSGK